jgi:long-chain acyl-CoA synthetase
MSAADILDRDFGTIADVIRAQAAEVGEKSALIDAQRTISYAELDRLMDRIAAALQRDGVGKAEVAAICATTSATYGATFLGILRAGAVVAPLAPSSTPESLVLQLKDCGAKVFFLDKGVAEALAGVMDEVSALRVALDGSDAGVPLEAWLAPEDAKPVLHEIDPDQGFNIIYSSGTTGTPKGIVQPHRMRWGQIRRGVYPSDAVTLISTPLYSNTTLVSFLPTVSNGGTAVLLGKFDG